MKLTNKTTAGRAGFTLIEMIVVIVIISILASIAIPSIISLFNAGSDSQAYNVLSAHLASARAQAIRESNYVLVHCQRADDDAAGGSVKGKFFLAIMTYDRVNKVFKSDSAVPPAAIPGKNAFGQLRNPFVKNASGGGGEYDDLSNLDDFTTFNIIFSPSGTVVTAVNGAGILMDTNDPVFKNTPPTARTKLWNPDFLGTPTQARHNGVTAVTLFDYVQLNGRNASNGPPSDRAAYLNDNGQFIAINAYTGQLFPKE